MLPRLLEIGPITVYSYGLMLGISFIVASILLTRELKRKGLKPELGNTITLIALVGGISGSKILYLFEHWGFFLADPIGMTFSPGGLTWYGGFLLATGLIFLYTRSKGVRFLQVADAASPGLLWAYGIARIGCHLAGDGDYGFPTSLPWGTNYSNGTYPPSLAFKNFPEIASQFPGGVVPDTTPCHPTPIYEFLICTVLFWYLWKYRSKIVGNGRMFSLYLVLAGTERFLIEFLRLNPRLLFGLSEAQLIAIVLVGIGFVGFRGIPAKPEA